MKRYAVTRDIQASPEAVWSVLTDTESWPEWDPGMERVDGRFEVGSKVTFHTKMSDRAFPVKVTTLEPSRRIVLTGGMPLGLFKGERTFELTERGDGSTRLSTVEEFTGPLVRLFPIPDLQPAFEQFADGLKSRAESAG